MPIQISAQPTILSWDVQKAKLEQSGNGANVLQIQTQKPSIELESVKPKIQIDQSASFADAGLKNLKAFMNESVSYGLQIVSQGISRTVDQGNAYIEIQSGHNPIPDQAEYNAYGMFEKEFNYGTIPKNGPRISLIEGRVNTKFNPGSVTNQTMPQKVQMNFTPGNVNFYVKQYASISFNYEASKFKFSV